jgi:uncharacterized membrane protein
MNLRVTLFSAVVVVVTGGLVRAADDTPPPSFTKDVKPFVTKYCMQCHSGARAKKGYSVDSYESLTKSGRGGLVVPEEPDKSPLIRTMEGKGKKMPPARNAQPKAEEITMIREWIKAGAKNDTETAADDKKKVEPAEKKNEK